MIGFGINAPDSDYASNLKGHPQIAPAPFHLMAIG
jgi:hypothetical protein